MKRTRGDRDRDQATEALGRPLTRARAKPSRKDIEAAKPSRKDVEAAKPSLEDVEAVTAHVRALGSAFLRGKARLEWHALTLGARVKQNPAHAAFPDDSMVAEAHVNATVKALKEQAAALARHHEELVERDLVGILDVVNPPAYMGVAVDPAKALAHVGQAAHALWVSEHPQGRPPVLEDGGIRILPDAYVIDAEGSEGRQAYAQRVALNLFASAFRLSSPWNPLTHAWLFNTTFNKDTLALEARSRTGVTLINASNVEELSTALAMTPPGNRNQLDALTTMGKIHLVRGRVWWNFHPDKEDPLARPVALD